MPNELIARVAELVFDAPIDQSFTYRVPETLTVRAGQRVAAPLSGAERVGLVVGVRDDAAPGPRLRPLTRSVDAAPLLSPGALQLARFLAAQSLTSLGSTALALLPPPGPAIAWDEIAGAVEGDAPERPLVLTGSGRERRLLDRIAADSHASLVITSDVEGAARWAQRLEKFGPVARLDSGATDAERAAAWLSLTTGRARLAVGTRSALLAPLPAGRPWR